MAFKQVVVEVIEETIKRTVKRKIEIDMDFTQIYDSFYSLTLGLKSVKSFQLLFYVLKDVSGNNLNISNKVYDSFNAELIRLDGKGISRQTFYNCINELKDCKIISKVTTGQYFINPHIIWKDKIDKREQLIIADPFDSNKLAFNPAKRLLLPAPKPIKKD